MVFILGAGFGFGVSFGVLLALKIPTAEIAATSLGSVGDWVSGGGAFAAAATALWIARREHSISVRRDEARSAAIARRVLPALCVADQAASVVAKWAKVDKKFGDIPEYMIEGYFRRAALSELDSMVADLSDLPLELARRLGDLLGSHRTVLRMYEKAFLSGDLGRTELNWMLPGLAASFSEKIGPVAIDVWRIVFPEKPYQPQQYVLDFGPPMHTYFTDVAEGEQEARE